MWNVKISGTMDRNHFFGWLKTAFYSSVFFFFSSQPNCCTARKEFTWNIKIPIKRKRGKKIYDKLWMDFHWMQCIKWIFGCTCLLWTKLLTTIDCDNTLSWPRLNPLSMAFHTKMFVGIFIISLPSMFPYRYNRIRAERESLTVFVYSNLSSPSRVESMQH